MPSKSVDTGRAPDSVYKANKVKELILSGESIDDELSSETTSIDNSFDVPKVTSSSPKVEAKATQRVVVLHEQYRLTLMALDVSIGDHQVAIRLPNNGFKFEPIELNSEFVINYFNKDYNVVYLGGIFDFPGDDSWVIAFIRDKRK